MMYVLSTSLGFSAVIVFAVHRGMVRWDSQVKKDCQDYLAPRAITERLVLLALDIQVPVEFVGHQVTQGWMAFQDKQVFQDPRVGFAGSALTLKRCKAAAS